LFYSSEKNNFKEIKLENKNAEKPQSHLIALLRVDTSFPSVNLCSPHQFKHVKPMAAITIFLDAILILSLTLLK